MNKKLIIIIAIISISLSGCAGRYPSYLNSSIVVLNYGKTDSELIEYKFSIPNNLPSAEILRYEYIGEILSKKGTDNFIASKSNFNYLLTLNYGTNNKIYTAKIDIPTMKNLQQFAGFAAGFNAGSNAVATGIAQGRAIQRANDEIYRANMKKELASRKTHFMNFNLVNQSTKKLVYTSKISFSTSEYTFDELVPLFISAFAQTYSKAGQHKIDISRLR